MKGYIRIYTSYVIAMIIMLIISLIFMYLCIFIPQFKELFDNATGGNNEPIDIGYFISIISIYCKFIVYGILIPIAMYFNEIICIKRIKK